MTPAVQLKGSLEAYCLPDGKSRDHFWRFGEGKPEMNLLVNVCVCVCTCCTNTVAKGAKIPRNFVKTFWGDQGQILRSKNFILLTSGQNCRIATEIWLASLKLAAKKHLKAMVLLGDDPFLFGKVCFRESKIITVLHRFPAPLKIVTLLHLPSW